MQCSDSQMKKLIILIFLCSASLMPLLGIGQRMSQGKRPPGMLIIIKRALRYNFRDRGDSGKFVSLAGNAFVAQDRMKFYADSMVLNQKENVLEAFGHVHLNDADTVQIYAGYLKYLGKEKWAYLRKGVRMKQGGALLLTPSLDYDTQMKIAIYKNWGKLYNKGSRLTSKEGYYYGDTKDMYFKKKVDLITPDYHILTDTLLYNLNSQISTFNCPTVIHNGLRIIHTREGYYDMKFKKGTFSKRPVIYDTSYTIVADTIAFDDRSGRGELVGTAIYRSKDAKEGFDLIANNIKINNKRGAIMATRDPLMIIKQDKDSIFVVADTLFSNKFQYDYEIKGNALKWIKWLKDSTASLKKQVTVDDKKMQSTASQHLKSNKEKPKEKDEQSDPNRYFEAYHHVKIYMDSTQAICDSMYFSREDSIFRMIGNPIFWARENQLSGDTVYLKLVNNNPDQMFVINNVAVLSKEPESPYFDQIAGNTLFAKFKKGHLDYVRTRGTPAQSVYYSRDEKNKFIGVNKSTSDLLIAYFTDKERSPEKILMVNNIEGTMYPMHQVDHDQIKIRHFQWLPKKRPKNRADLLNKQ